MAEHCSLNVTVNTDGTIDNFGRGVTFLESTAFRLFGILPKRCVECDENKANCPIATHEDAIKFRETLRP